MWCVVRRVGVGMLGVGVERAGGLGNGRASYLYHPRVSMPTVVMVPAHSARAGGSTTKATKIWLSIV